MFLAIKASVLIATLYIVAYIQTKLCAYVLL